ncbi:MAG: transketolase C-terminal domain-containing protein [Candidatus Bathyarchaeia archaeon]
MSYEVMVGNKATATACKLARVKVAAVFPITPQTTITEYLSEIYASGELPGFEFVNAEGELSSQVIVQAAEAVGARSFTCTSGPGLLYMHHPMQETASKRLPLVMAVVHRGVKSMQPDHSDLMSQQWQGWLHLYVENAQEILDSVVMAYKIAEDKRIRLPVAVGYDGYVLSYTAEPVEIPAQEDIDKFLPPYKPMPSILPDEADPKSFARGWGEGDPMKPWQMHHQAALNGETVIKEVFADWGKKFGRTYGNGMIEPYRVEGADCVITAMGTIAGTTMAAIDKLWADGKKVGLIKIRSFLPFPRNDFQEIAKSVGAIGIFDRSCQPGMGGPVFHQMRSTLYDEAKKTPILCFIGGLSGKEVRIDDMYKIGEKTLKVAKGEKLDASIQWV